MSDQSEKSLNLSELTEGESEDATCEISPADAREMMENAGLLDTARNQIGTEQTGAAIQDLPTGGLVSLSLDGSTLDVRSETISLSLSSSELEDDATCNIEQEKLADDISLLPTSKPASIPAPELTPAPVSVPPVAVSKGFNPPVTYLQTSLEQLDPALLKSPPVELVQVKSEPKATPVTPPTVPMPKLVPAPQPESTLLPPKPISLPQAPLPERSAPKVEVSKPQPAPRPINYAPVQTTMQQAQMLQTVAPKTYATLPQVPRLEMPKKHSYTWVYVFIVALFLATLVLIVMRQKQAVTELENALAEARTYYSENTLQSRSKAIETLKNVQPTENVFILAGETLISLIGGETLMAKELERDQLLQTLRAPSGPAQVVILQPETTDTQILTLTPILQIAPNAAPNALKLTEQSKLICLLAHGKLLESQGHVLQAESAYKRATELAPGSAEAWWRKGRLALGAGKRNEGMKALQEAARLAPNSTSGRAAKEILGL